VFCVNFHFKITNLVCDYVLIFKISKKKSYITVTSRSSNESSCHPTADCREASEIMKGKKLGKSHL
jgi:hypothetical protein